MKNASEIADLIRLVVGIDRSNPYTIAVHSHNGCGVDVVVCRIGRTEDGESDYVFIEGIRDIDKREDRLQAAFAAAEAIAAGTYAGKGGDTDANPTATG